MPEPAATGAGGAKAVANKAKTLPPFVIAMIVVAGAGIVYYMRRRNTEAEAAADAAWMGGPGAVPGSYVADSEVAGYGAGSLLGGARPVDYSGNLFFPSLPNLPESTDDLVEAPPPVTLPPQPSINVSITQPSTSSGVFPAPAPQPAAPPAKARGNRTFQFTDKAGNLRVVDPITGWIDLYEKGKGGTKAKRYQVSLTNPILIAPSNASYTIKRPTPTGGGAPARNPAVHGPARR